MSEKALVRVTSPGATGPGHRYEGLIICLEHLQQVIDDAPPPVEKLHASQVAFWGLHCFLCGVEPISDRLCQNEDCRRALHPQWPAVYCCNDCAWKDA